MFDKYVVHLYSPAKDTGGGEKGGSKGGGGEKSGGKGKGSGGQSDKPESPSTAGRPSGTAPRYPDRG